MQNGNDREGIRLPQQTFFLGFSTRSLNDVANSNWQGI